MKYSFFLLFVLVHIHTTGSGQESGKVVYPFPVGDITVAVDDTIVHMAYMDAKPEDKGNGKTVVLLHGKNFSGYYWQDVMKRLVNDGYRVIVPDQVGWGHSGKPMVHYSFHMLALNTSNLLDSLQLKKVIVVGHSMGGMLASRFSMLYPGKVEKLVLENPIGLEDYRRFVPYRPTDQLTTNELKATYDSYKRYQQTYYPAWKKEYEQYVQAQAEALSDPDFQTIAKVNALTYQMIYEQPVCYEWDRLTMPVLLIIGEQDRTVVGKDQLTDAQKRQYGQYPVLGKKTQEQIKNSKLYLLPGIGHIPHVQDLDLFYKHLVDFIK